MLVPVELAFWRFAVFFNDIPDRLSLGHLKNIQHCRVYGSRIDAGHYIVGRHVIALVRCGVLGCRTFPIQGHFAVQRACRAAVVMAMQPGACSRNVSGARDDGFMAFAVEGPPAAFAL